MGKGVKTPAKKPRVSRVPKTRNGGTQTEAGFWGHLRSSLRRSYRYWKPLIAAKLAARRPHTKTHSRDRQKWDYQCASCREWFPDKQVDVDHIVPCGRLLSWEDVVPFLQRLIPEDPAAFQVLCDECHQKKTNAERGLPHG